MNICASFILLWTRRHVISRTVTEKRDTRSPCPSPLLEHQDAACKGRGETDTAYEDSECVLFKAGESAEGCRYRGIFYGWISNSWVV